MYVNTFALQAKKKKIDVTNGGLDKENLLIKLAAQELYCDKMYVHEKTFGDYI